MAMAHMRDMSARERISRDTMPTRRPWAIAERDTFRARAVLPLDGRAASTTISPGMMPPVMDCSFGNGRSMPLVSSAAVSSQSR